MEGSILCCPRWLRCGGASIRSTGITDTTGNRWFAVRDQYVASLAPLLGPLEAARDFAVQLTSSNQGRRGGGLGLSMVCGAKAEESSQGEDVVARTEGLREPGAVRGPEPLPQEVDAHGDVRDVVRCPTVSLAEELDRRWSVSGHDAR
jgi:hypothetical protein